MSTSSRIIKLNGDAPTKVEPLRFVSAVPVQAPPTAPALETAKAAEQLRRRSYDLTPLLDPSSVNKECDRMLEDARLKVSEIEKDAYQKGFAEGQKAGSEFGENAAESLTKQYAASLEALNRIRTELFRTSEREVIRLSLEIARKIIKREVAIDEELILALVKVALDRVADQALITVRVNPKDHHAIERHHAASPDAGTLSETVKLVEDPLIARGGCIIETESGTIDARIEEQLREIERGFFD